MDLHARIPVVQGCHAFIARLVEGDDGIGGHPYEALLLRGNEPRPINSVGVVLRIGGAIQGSDEIPLPDALSYLGRGDVVRVNRHGGEVRVVYRRASPHNVLFVTERCNSRCLMCSQPPREVEDSYLVDEILETIPLMSPETTELCITGGEPTLLGNRLLEIIDAVKQRLPQTALHMLSNGRRFAYTKVAQLIASVDHPQFMIGIPLYSDVADRHDFVVQAKGAFDETVRGIMNLGRFKQKIEVRFVIHKQTVDRLPATARFIARNLPFVDHVALMGLEMMGFTKPNLAALWIDPHDYQSQLLEAVAILREARIRVMIYNHQLCLLRQELWPYAVRSISDWKNIYMPECEPCGIRDRCGGFFASAPLRYSSHIRPVEASAAD